MSPAGVSCQGHHALGTGALTDYLSTAAQRGNLGILCGAGVSLWAPSNKPLADWLKGYLFELLAGPDNDLRSRTDLSFEKTISLLGWGIEFALERCYGGQRDGPNAWHHLIAGLMAQTKQQLDAGGQPRLRAIDASRPRLGLPAHICRAAIQQPKLPELQQVDVEPRHGGRAKCF